MNTQSTRMQPAFHRIIGLFLLAAAALLAFAPEQATAQRWSQRAEILAAVQQDGVTAALRDTLISVAKRNPDVQLRRNPEDPTNYSVNELQDALIEESGIALNSANRVYVTYDFQYRSSNFDEKITSLYYIYNSGSSEAEDISVFYIDATQPAVQRILQQKGTYQYDEYGSPTNLSQTIPFVNQLQFAKIASPRRDNGVEITKIGNRPVREGFERQKRDLFRKVVQFTY